MFERLEKGVDIVGVRGNNFGWMRTEKHDLESELDQASKISNEKISKIKPHRRLLIQGASPFGKKYQFRTMQKRNN